MSEKNCNTNSRRKFIRTGAIAGGPAVRGLTVGLPSIANLDKSGKRRQKLGLFSLPVVDASVVVSQTATYRSFSTLKNLIASKNRYLFYLNQH